ncbi:hypothetical protein WN51_07860 [Melipona quadrifasciata]|uniref:Uncharacterized protein n=1 Tax=Melipona quadrifasciata TaxID=166423 RepID=A0A0M9A932_9HYME|nr:hypothetical protein WN51_07860 [Melipona quadrifasciata]
MSNENYKLVISRKRCGEYQQIYENLAKDKSENKSSEEVHINDENEVELGNISSDEDNEFVPIEKERSIVLNYSSDSYVFSLHVSRLKEIFTMEEGDNLSRITFTRMRFLVMNWSHPNPIMMVTQEAMFWRGFNLQDYGGFSCEGNFSVPKLLRERIFVLVLFEMM